ncbi:putative DNA mismatch repair protein MSH3 [Rosellinia necatrix]|uniref:MutS protein homolog 3 n=1 Tax=Rosellinia necatrix TaxID=77044 RepID=A0A1W2TGR6_ROSNE|nr:putative DNA mismatch repair protein MSH3 [Rosellinia necatrix]
MMAGPAKSKRQQSLTSFFTPKTTNNTNQSQEQVSPDAQAGNSQVGNSQVGNSQASNSQTGKSLAPNAPRKRPLENDTDNGNPVPLRKKSKTNLVEKPIAAVPKSPAKDPPVATSSGQPNAHTERYLYDGSSPRDGRDAVSAEEQQDDAQEKRRRQELHRKFVQKLGRPDSMALMRRRNHQIDDDAQAVNNEDGEEEEEEEAPQPAKSKKKGSKTGKLTPMEIQFLDIKRKHMDTLLIVEVGYKFKFFGEDARTAAKELSIVCIPGKFRYDEHPSEAHLDRFASASIPVHRLPVHAKRLVAAGHKVGVVRQIETAALKKVGDNRNAPFTRKLTNVYTKGTYVDEIGELDQNSDTSTSAGGYLLCITETAAKGWGTDEKVDVGIIAVQPTTGDIIYDNFEDGFMRSEIETRLLHISPCEFLIVGELTGATEKLIQHLSGSSTNVFGDRSRVERIGKSKTIAAEAYSHVTKFYSNRLKENEGNEQASALLDKVLKLPEAVTICLSSMINHLTEYGLEHIFDLTKYFQSFSARHHMLLNGTTLESLEVYRNQTDHSEKGSLFWALDKTMTRFGQRLLRKWVGRPLLDKDQLEERVAAVEELLENASTPKVEQLERLLKNTKSDLERSLIRIYYGKCTRPELLAVLQTLQRIASEFVRVKDSSDTGFASPAISDAIASLPLILPTVLAYLERINAEAARKDDKYAFFREAEETEAITDHKLGIASVEQELDAHRDAIASKLGKKPPVPYVTVAGIEYLVEVSNADLKRVPASWIKVSGTKRLSRFHTPEVVALVSERDQHREALSAACDAAFASLLRSVAADYQPLRDAVAALATLDCLLSLSRVAASPGYTRPRFLPADAPPTVAVTAGRHPVAEQTLAGSYIPFTTTLAAPAPLAHLVTGPNMGGKSSFVRAVALLVLLAQVGSFVPADAMALTLADAIHTRMGARDNLFRGESTFMVEVSETARILRAATPRSLVVLDELGRGTSTHDGTAIAQAVLHHVVEHTRCLTLFITHYQSLARVVDGLGGRCTNVHMRFTAAKRAHAGNGGPRIGEARSGDRDGETENAELEGDEEITFLYEVGEGVAHRSYGLNVARLARIPRRVLDVAGKKSQELEDEIKKRRLGGAVKLLMDVLCEDSAQLEHLVSSIEQL